MKHQRNLDQVAERLIEIAGPLPERTFETWMISDGMAQEVRLSAREYLFQQLGASVSAFHVRSERKITESELTTQFKDIYRASRKLLLALQVGLEKPVLDDMPNELRYGGLQALAALVAESAGAKSGEELLQDAVRGVHRLHRWSRVAMQRELSAAAANRARRQATGREWARHSGNVALNKFLREVVVNLWCLAFGREIAVGPALVQFVQEAATAIDQSLADDDAVVKRLQRLRLHRAFRALVPTAGA